MHTTTVDRFLDRYRAAWQNRDPEAVAVLFTEDARYRELPFAAAYEGPLGVRDYWAGATATQSGVTVRYGRVLVAGDRAAVEWWTTLTNDGAPVTLAGSFHLRFADDGRCSELREYWHVTEGNQEPSAGWGE